jgi:hypothetical protein
MFPQGNIRKTGIRSPLRRPRSFRGFGQYSAGDYSTDMWKGSIYEASPVNTTNWLGTATNLLTTVAKVATAVVPSILNYQVQRKATETQKDIEQARLANETLLAQKQSAYYEQLLAQSKANAAASQNQQAGVASGYTPTVTSSGYIPSPAMEYITSASWGRGAMYGEYAVESIPQLADLKKYLPYIGFGVLALVLLLRRPAPQIVQAEG